MKYILLFSVLFYFYSCNSSKPLSDDMVKVIVSNKYINEGCDIILIVNNDERTELNPLNLDSRYRKVGTTIAISYSETRIQQHGTCGQGKLIEIKKVQKI